MGIPRKGKYERGKPFGSAQLAKSWAPSWHAPIWSEPEGYFRDSQGRTCSDCHTHEDFSMRWNEPARPHNFRCTNREGHCTCSSIVDHSGFAKCFWVKRQTRIIFGIPIALVPAGFSDYPLSLPRSVVPSSHRTSAKILLGPLGITFRESVSRGSPNNL